MNVPGTKNHLFRIFYEPKTGSVSESVHEIVEEHWLTAAASDYQMFLLFTSSLYMGTNGDH